MTMPSTKRTDRMPSSCQDASIRSTKRTPEAVAESMLQLRAQMRADNPELTGAEWDDFAERLGDEVKAGLAKRVRRSRREGE